MKSRAGIPQPTDSPADLPKFEPRCDVSRREREMKTRTGTQNTRTCALPALRSCAVFHFASALIRQGSSDLRFRSAVLPPIATKRRGPCEAGPRHLLTLLEKFDEMLDISRRLGYNVAQEEVNAMSDNSVVRARIDERTKREP